MSPDDLSAKGTEHGLQAGLFAWAAMAQMYGYAVADDMEAYNAKYFKQFQPVRYPVPQLRWLHAIPNGGLRSAKAGALMKAEGVKKGVADIFLPIADEINRLHGLYIEMKAGTNKQSDEQIEFEKFVSEQGYAYHVCYDWRSAATILKDYLT